jgi:c-di-GMP-binding flagellar brake protein YcgR
MLRSQEVRTVRRSELRQMDTDQPLLRVPLKYVKKRRVILQRARRSTITAISTTAVMKNERWVATSAPESSR